MISKIVDRLANRIRWGYLTAFLLLLISYIITFDITRNLFHQSERVDHTNKVMNSLEVLQLSVTEAETSLRGFMVVKDEGFLGLFTKSPAKVDSIEDQVYQLLSDNPQQLQRMDTLKGEIQKKILVMNTTLNLYRNNGFQIDDSLNHIIQTGNTIMGNIRHLIAGMQNIETDLMSARNSSFKATSNLVTMINIVSLIVAILLTFYSVVTFNNENRAKQKADKNAEAFRNQLEIRIAELHKLNTELVELKGIEKFAATGRIARTIAHEVRNPLTNINLAAEHLKSEITPSSETDLLIDMITRNANRINVLISDLLNSTKAAQLEFVVNEVDALLDESLEFARDRIELKGIKVIRDYSEDVSPVLVDAGKIRIAFLNLVVNAIEAMPPNSGILKIKTYNKNNRVVVTITDNGKGMSDEEMINLFEPFYTTKENGTGLGLTNTQNIILSHKANIKAESKPGEGTTFTITFNPA